jgi:PPK2 family polyphosphate:nucleotide phosphotransferase
MSYLHKVHPGERIRLRDLDPGATHGLSRQEAESQFATLNTQLTALQELQFAAGQNSILIILQGLDTAGKDGTIRQVMAQFNPAGCRVESFKAPTPYEAAHDFLWRAHRATPPRGMIAIFNRSHYEDVLVVRVHKLAPRTVWESRFAHINHFEQLLLDNNTIILKFLLYISKEEQRERLIAREQDREKSWKLSATDWPEHERYDEYIGAYEDAVAHCSTEGAPWHIVPANHKWFRNFAVAHAIVESLKPFRSSWREELERRGREHLAVAVAHRPPREGSRRLPPAPMPAGSRS